MTGPFALAGNGPITYEVVLFEQIISQIEDTQGAVSFSPGSVICPGSSTNRSSS